MVFSTSLVKGFEKSPKKLQWDAVAERTGIIQGYYHGNKINRGEKND